MELDTADQHFLDAGASARWRTTARDALIQFLVMAMLVTLLVFLTDQQPVLARTAAPAVPESIAVPQTAALPAALVESRGVPDDAPVRFAGAQGTLMPVPDGGGWGRTSQMVTGDLNGDTIDDVVAIRDIFNTGRTVVAIGLGEGDGTLTVPQYVDLDSTLTAGQRAGLDLGDVDGDGALDIVVGVRNPVLTRVFLNDGLGGFADETGRVIDVVTESPRSILAEDVDGDATVDLLVTENGTSGSRVQLYRNLGGGAFDLGTTLFESADTVRAVDLGDLTGDGLLDIVVADSRSTVNVLVQRAVDAEPVNNVFDDDGPEEGLNGGDGLGYDAVYVWITPDLTDDGLADVVLVSRYDRGCLVDAEGCLVVAGGDGDGALSNPSPVDDDKDGIDDNGRTHPLRDVYWSLDHPATPPEPADLDGDGLLEFVIFGSIPHLQIVEVDPTGPITSTRLTTGNGTPPDHVQSATKNGATNNDALYVGDSAIVDLDLDGRLDIVLGQLIGSYSEYTPDVTWLRNDPNYPWGFATGTTVDEIRAPIDDRRSAEDSVLVDWSGDDVLDLVTFSPSLDLLMAVGKGDGTFQPGTVAAEDPTAGVAGCRSGLSSDIIDGIHAADFDGDGATDLAYVSNDDVVHHLCVIRGDGAGGVPDVTAVAGVGTDVTNQPAAWTDYEGDGDVDLVLAETDAGDGTLQLYRNDGAAGFSRVEVLRVVGVTLPVFAAGDVDGDGRADLVYRTGSAGADILHTHLQQPDGTLAGPPSRRRRSPSRPSSASASSPSATSMAMATATSSTTTRAISTRGGGCARTSPRPTGTAPSPSPRRRSIG